jgi:hypothetical protein
MHNPIICGVITGHKWWWHQDDHRGCKMTLFPKVLRFILQGTCQKFVSSTKHTKMDSLQMQRIRTGWFMTAVYPKISCFYCGTISLLTVNFFLPQLPALKIHWSSVELSSLQTHEQWATFRFSNWCHL